MGKAATTSLLSQKQIAVLHVARRDLNLTDESYRDILMRIGGCESSRDLHPIAFERVMTYFAKLGFRSTWTKRTYGNRPGMASPAQVDLMRVLWRQYHGDDENDIALNRWLTKFHKVSALRFVDQAKATKILAALKAMAARAKNQ